MSNKAANAFSFEDFSLEGLIEEFSTPVKEQNADTSLKEENGQKRAAKNEIIDISPLAAANAPAQAVLEEPVQEQAKTQMSLPENNPQTEPTEPDTSMKDPLQFSNDIEFDVRFRGYDKLQVDDYIDKITLDYNAICENCAALEKENHGLRRTLAELYKLKEG